MHRPSFSLFSSLNIILTLGCLLFEMFFSHMKFWSFSFPVDRPIATILSVRLRVIPVRSVNKIFHCLGKFIFVCLIFVIPIAVRLRKTRFWWQLLLAHFFGYFLLNSSLFLLIQSGPKKCVHSLLINVFGINLNEISISGWECNIIFSQQMAQALLQFLLNRWHRRSWLALMSLSVSLLAGADVLKCIHT